MKPRCGQGWPHLQALGKTPPSRQRPSWQHSLPRGPSSTFKDITATCVCDRAATSVHSDPPASLTYKDPVMTVDLPGQSRRLSPSFTQSYVPSPFATPSNTSMGSRDQDTDICGPTIPAYRLRFDSSPVTYREVDYFKDGFGNIFPRKPELTCPLLPMTQEAIRNRGTGSGTRKEEKKIKKKKKKTIHICSFLSMFSNAGQGTLHIH